MPSCPRFSRPGKRSMLSQSPLLQRIRTSQGHIKYDAYRGGQIQTAYAALNGDADMPIGQRLYILGQSTGLRPEKKTVTGRELKMLHGVPCPGTGTDESSPGSIGLKISLQRRPYRNIHIRPVVQTGSLQMFIINTEAQGFNKMQASPRACTQAGNIARVRWYFRMIKNDVQHGQYKK